MIKRLAIIPIMVLVVIVIFQQQAYAFDYESENSVKDVKQYNEKGDNYIIIESKQEGILDKITNKAEEFLWGDSYEDSKVTYKDNDYRNNDDYIRQPYYQNDNNYVYDDYYGDFGYNNEAITVKLIAVNNDHVRADYKVKVGQETVTVDRDEFNDDGKAKIKFNVNSDTVNVCINPVGQKNSKLCERFDVDEGELIFHVH